jgi:BMFP domain-containing protein YqiC
MVANPKLLDDFARVASGALGTVAGMREEARARMREGFERVLERMDVVTRDEFEAVRAMAARAREEQEAMATRLAVLEARLATAEVAAPSLPAPKRPRRPRTKGAA